MRFRACTFLLAVVSLLAASGQTPKRSVKQQVDDWPEYGGTLAGQRYSTARQITKSNVRTLQPAWVFHTHALDTPSALSNPRASFEATPVLWSNTLYFDTPFDAVFAVDAATGKLKWMYDPNVNRELPITIVTSRGVSLWHASRPTKQVCGSDVVFVATLDRRLIARDATTGAACPGFGEGGTVDLARGIERANRYYLSYTSAPTIVGDTIVLGSSIADNQRTFTASGAVRGFDAVTGKQKWSWQPIRPVPGGDPHATSSGNAWSTLAADPEHDLVFVPTGSASLDYYGGTRPGDNRDADSLVALRASSGEKVWAFQLVHHDIWDYDTPSQPLLFTFRKTIPAVAITTKTSMVFVFNRLTGEPLYPIEERAVPQSKLAGERSWPTQPFSSLPPLTPQHLSAADIQLPNPNDEKFCLDLLSKLDNEGIFTPPSAQGTVIYPGILGGTNWGSSAFDPESGVLFARVSSMPFMAQELKHYPTSTLGQWASTVKSWFGYKEPTPVGGDFLSPDSGGVKQKETSNQEGTPYWLAREAFMTPGGIPCAPQPFGSIVALDLDTGEKKWSVAHGEMAVGTKGSVGAGGVIVTASGLVFAASSNDSLLRAYDSNSGQELWRGQLPVPANATPMTYVANGRQFVVIAAGGHGYIGKGQSDVVVAFAFPDASKAERRQKRATPRK